MARKVLIDTDPGIDDALALTLAFSSPEISIEAITTVAGNVPAGQCTANALRVLDALEIEDAPPVAQGCEKPLQGGGVSARHVHGQDGLGGLTELRETDGTPRYPPSERKPGARHGVDLMLETIRESGEPLTLIALGPLTNVAVALERDPETMARLERVIAMGGSLSGRGNVTATAEFNFYADPLAASQVAASGLPLTLVGLDVTQQTILLKRAIEERLPKPETRRQRLVWDLCRRHFDVSEELRGIPGLFLHDPLAVGAVIDPSFVKTLSYPAAVETEGRLTRGMVVLDLRPSFAGPPAGTRIEGCVEVDAARFLDFFLDRVLAA